MLRHLSVEHIALIDQLEMDFSAGLNILTGETGAGKSMVIDAVNLVLGAKADRERIQNGQERARVEAVFTTADAQALCAFLRAQEMDDPEDEAEEIILAREITLAGKSTARVNGRIVPLSLLRELSSHLMDVHGQHEHQSLLSSAGHIDLLDRLGGSDIAQLASKMRTALEEYRSIVQQLSGGLQSEEERLRRMDILRYQIDEIERAKPQVGEDEELSLQRERLLHVERIREAVEQAHELLYGGSDIPGATGLLGQAVRELGGVARFDPRLEEMHSRLEELGYQLDDAAMEVGALREDAVSDPRDLERIESRLELLRMLKRKYGASIEEVMAFGDQAALEYEELDSSAQRMEALQALRDEKARTLYAVCTELSQRRRQVAGELRASIEAELSDLGMPNAVFEVAFEPTPAFEEARFGEHGLDRLEFLLSVNTGEAPKPLSRIASGGEVSRIMLAIKTVFARQDAIPSLIFDEIDAGISGRMAQAVGEKMVRIAQARQVICVTHLPQIAALADTHHRIYKTDEGTATRTHVQALDEAQRAREVALMASGAQVGQTSLKHAQELLDAARMFKDSLAG